MYASEAKKFEFLINLDHFSKFLKLGYSQIKIDRIADSKTPDYNRSPSYKC